MSTKIISTIEPKNEIFPVVSDGYLGGSFRTVIDLTTRDDIDDSLRKSGMWVKVLEDGNIYQLEDGLTNSDWTAIIGDFPGGSLGGTFIETTVLNVDGYNGTVNVKCSIVEWSDSADSSRGTKSTEAVATTTTNSANQVVLTLTQPADTVYKYSVSISGRDTAADGGYAAEWRETYQRRTGVSSGNAVSKTSSPAAIGEDKWGTLSSASFSVAASTNDVVVKVSPAATANVNWRIQVEVLRNG